jgi:hypothetical protein
MSAAVEQQLSLLATMSTFELAQAWERVTRTPPPPVSPSLMRLALAWEIQAAAYGGLSRTTRTRLAQIAGAKTRTSEAKSGMRLVREWNGKPHVVTVGEDGIIRWNGSEWRSLSEVARAITGTRWSGPAFFGLKRKLAA